MVINLIGPENKKKWNPIWVECYNIFQSSPYEIKLWNDKEDIDNLIIEDDNRFFKLINQLHPIYKIDYARYIILHKFGGMYADLDVEIVRDFIPFLNPNKIYIAEGGFGASHLVNNLIITPPNLKIWEDIKHAVKSEIILGLKNYPEHMHKHQILVPKITGPEALTKHFMVSKHPYELLSHQHFSSKESDLSFARHHFTNSWI